MTRIPGALDHLRAETADLHARVEAAMPLMSIRSRDEYVLALRRLAGLYLLLEPRILGAPGLPRVVRDLHQRRKLGLILGDLERLGVAPLGAADRLALLPTMGSTAAGLGGLYVLEGATLGGQFVSRHLRGVLGPDIAPCLEFFSGYGTRTGLMWGKFRSVVEGYMLAAADCDPTGYATALREMTTAAVDTFRAYESWFSTP